MNSIETSQQSSPSSQHSLRFENELMLEATQFAKLKNHDVVTPVHLAIILFSGNGPAIRICKKHRVPVSKVLAQLTQLLNRQPTSPQKLKRILPDKALKCVLVVAKNEKNRQSHPYVTEDHLLVGISENRAIADALARAGFKRDYIREEFKNSKRKFSGDSNVFNAMASEYTIASLIAPYKPRSTEIVRTRNPTETLPKEAQLKKPQKESVPNFVDTPNSKLVQTSARYFSVGVGNEKMNATKLDKGKISEIIPSSRTRLLRLAETMKKRVPDQEEAVNAVASYLLRSKANLSNHSQVAGSFLMLGPIGMSEIFGKALAHELYGSEDRIIEIDLSEYQEKDSLYRLIGSSVADHEEDGILTDALLTQPASVVIFHEVDKAHSKVINLVFKILSEGKIIDGRNNVVDCSNIIALVSISVVIKGDTLDSRIRDRLLTDARKRINSKLLKMLKVINCNPLSRRHFESLARDMLKKYTKPLEKRKITVELTDEALSFIMKLCYDGFYGIQKLSQFMEENVLTELSRHIVKGDLIDNCNVFIIIEDEKIKCKINPYCN